MFVNQTAVAVALDGNTVLIRPKMDFATKSACMDALASVAPGKGTTNVAMHLGAYQVALMQHNIVSWSGPAFAGVACTPENIARLDPDEPLVERVLEEIASRNPLGKESAAEKKDDTSAGEPPSEGSE